MINKLLKNFKKPVVILFFSMIIALVSFSLKFIPYFQQLELSAIDIRFKEFPLSEKADSSIVLVAIDNSSLQYAQEFDIQWPWPREFYALITDYLAEKGAKAVLYDIQFYESDYNRADLSASDSDNRFAESLNSYRNTILGVQLSPDSSLIPNDIERFTLKIDGKLDNYTPQMSGAQFPISLLREKVDYLGVINIQPDDDGVIRRCPLFYKLNQHYLPQMSFNAYLQLINQDNVQQTNLRFDNHTLFINNKAVKLDHSNNYLINWYGNGGVEGVFKYLPIKSLIQSASANMYGNQPVISDQFFKDKFVIIGATADGLMDLKTSPYSKVMPGMEIWATILSNFNNNHHIRFIPDLFLFITLLLLSFLVSWIFVRLKSLYANLLIIALLLITIFSIMSLWQFRIYFNLVIPVIVLLLSYLFIVFVSYMIEGRSKKEIRQIFTRYLHPDIIETLIKNPDQIDMGGEEIEATVMFSDIYNFTTYSEGKHPKQLVQDLNEYFTTITNIILDHNGLLDKYTGDGLMAVFGAPLPRTDHAFLACKAAVLHKKFAQQIAMKSNSPASFFHLNTRLGINSGILVAGNIGSEKRMDYTAIGDPVNLSARLEGVNKVFKTQIIISESTWKFVQNDFVCRELDYLRVKGKTEPTRIYELIDEHNSLTSYDWINDYLEALHLYREGKFDRAKYQFEKLFLSVIKDNASATMAERCDYLIKNPPENWDGILSLNIK